MASKYRKVDPRIWHDEKFRQLNIEQKLITFNLFTAQSNRIGLFSFSPARAAEDLDIEPETFGKGFRKVSETLRWAFDKPSRTLFIPTWWKYNPPANPNILTGCLADLSELPNTPLLTDFCDNETYLSGIFLTTFKKWIETFRKGLANSSTTGTGTGSGTEEQPPENPGDKSLVLKADGVKITPWELCDLVGEMRRLIYVDPDYDTHSKEHLGIAKNIIAKGSGHRGEVAARLNTLGNHALTDTKVPPYWVVTLKKLSSDWEQLALRMPRFKPKSKNAQDIAEAENRLGAPDGF